MTVWYKQGVLGDLQQVARKGLGRVAELFEETGLDLNITSLRDGNHMAGSLHYDGLAFDFQYTNAVSRIIPVPTIKEALGFGWDIVLGNNYIHCEYDPKQTVQ